MLTKPPPRSRASRLLAAALALALAAGLASSLPPASAADLADPAAPAAAPGHTGPDRSVTLVTGDRVLVRDGDVAEIQPGPGRDRIQFMAYTLDDHHYVVPADAQPLIDAGRLDRRLFDVRTLLAWGYDDAARADLPLIVTGSAMTAARDQHTVRRLGSLRGEAVRTPKSQTGEFWTSLTVNRTAARADSGTVWLDGRAELSLDVSVPQIGAPAAWQAGYTGAGVRIAVLDSGIDAAHPDFAGRIAEARNFTNAPDTDDTVGHGTHVASTIAGSGAASGGKYRGVAPDASLLIGKVCETRYCTESAMLAGMEWAASTAAADVVNVSIGGLDSPGVDPLEQAVNTLTAQYGTLFVISAGNDSLRGSIGSPGSADAALTVGAVDAHDQRAEFSSQGPRVGDGAIKPDITAPGVGIVAARARNAAELPNPVGEYYTRLSGTSMAAPHVTGAAALLAQRQAGWQAPELKAALMGSAVPTPGLDAFAQGAGRVDVARAITQTVTAEAGSLSLGTQRWPHADDEPVSRTVSYRNHGSTPVTLQLSAEAVGPQGTTAPGGMFQLSAAEITVPAGSTAGVTLTADTRVAGPDGHYTGAVTATASGTSVRTPFAIERETEHYDVTITHLGRDGAAPPIINTLLFKLDEPYSAQLNGPDNVTTLRLPKGNYTLHSFIVELDKYGADLVQPLITVDRDQQVVLDARDARPIRVSVPNREAREYLGAVRTDRKTSWIALNSLLYGNSTDIMYTGHVGPAVPDDEFAVAVHSKWGAPGPAGDFHNSPYEYNLAWSRYGRTFDGLQDDVTDRELAAVDVRYEVRATGRIGLHSASGMPGGRPELGFGRAITFDLPARRTEYHLAGPGLVWDRGFDQATPGPPWIVQEVYLEQDSVYQPGRRYAERWNHPVFSPTGGDARQSGEEIVVDLRMDGDGSGHAGSVGGSTARTTLYRNGVQIAETDNDGYIYATVPPEPATYRVDVEGARNDGAELSVRHSGSWTFPAAGHYPRTTKVTPLLAAKFRPELDALDGARAGRPFLIPVTAEGLAAGARVKGLTVEISYDDGSSWQRAQLVPAGKDRWQALVRHPQGDGFASLRATVSDTTGITATHTTIRAYRLHR